MIQSRAEETDEAVFAHERHLRFLSYIFCAWKEAGDGDGIGDGAGDGTGDGSTRKQMNSHNSSIV